MKCFMPDCTGDLKIKFQNFHLYDSYPQTQTCSLCGAVKCIDKYGILTYYDAEGNIIHFKKESEANQ